MIADLELPEGWISVLLPDVVFFQEGPGLRKFQYTEKGIPFINIRTIKDTGIDKSICQHLAPEEVQEKYRHFLLDTGDIVCSTSGTIGKTAVITDKDLPLMLNTSVIRFREMISNTISRSYIHAYLKSNCFIFQTLKYATGTAQRNIGPSHLNEFEFPLPPLAEQKVIAEKLDTLLAQVETTKARLERIPQLLKRFRQSVLAAAVSGRLTEEWRTEFGSGQGREVINADASAKTKLWEIEPSLKKKKSSIECEIDDAYTFDLPGNWDFTTWGKVSEWITYGFTKPMPKSENGVKLLTAKDVQYFQVNVAEAGLTTKQAFESLSDKDRPKKGDLLITKDGSIGRAALVRSDEPFCINQSVAVCWLRSTTMNKQFLEYLANCEFTQKFVKEKAQGMAIQHLSIVDYAKCPLPVPPTEEQTEIVRRVEQLFAFADSIEQKANAALERVNNLTQSILAKAFKGELTADWRAANPDLISGENSAEALLKKIKSEREASASNKKTKKNA